MSQFLPEARPAASTLVPAATGPIDPGLLSDINRNFSRPDLVPEPFMNYVVDYLAANQPGIPISQIQGFLTFIYPHVDQQTRTVTVRFELNNPGHRLRPGTTATVKIKVPPREIGLLEFDVRVSARPICI